MWGGHTVGNTKLWFSGGTIFTAFLCTSRRKSERSVKLFEWLTESVFECLRETDEWECQYTADCCWINLKYFVPVLLLEFFFFLAETLQFSLDRKVVPPIPHDGIRVWFLPWMISALKSALQSEWHLARINHIQHRFWGQTQVIRAEDVRLWVRPAQFLNKTWLLAELKYKDFISTNQLGQ